MNVNPRTVLAALASLAAAAGRSVPRSPMAGIPGFTSTRRTFNRSQYTPKGPVIAGAAKCAKKGHRPPNKRTRSCTRCGADLSQTVAA